MLAADYAKVYHNLGTAYARMFMYDKAVIYYDEAYRELEDIARLKADGNLTQYNRAVDERLDRWRTEYIKYSKTF